MAAEVSAMPLHVICTSNHGDSMCIYLLRPAGGWYPIEFILPEFVSYLHDLGERGVLCVGKG